jgi:hypothetical protein
MILITVSMPEKLRSKVMLLKGGNSPDAGSILKI